MWNLKKICKWLYLQNRNRGTDIENKLTATKVARWGIKGGFGINIYTLLHRVSLVAQRVKNPPAMQGTCVWSLHGEDPLEKGMATHSSIPVWGIPWIEEHGEVQPVGSQRAGHDWMTNTFTFTSLYTRDNQQGACGLCSGLGEGEHSHGQGLTCGLCTRLCVDAHKKKYCQCHHGTWGFQGIPLEWPPPCLSETAHLSLVLWLHAGGSQGNAVYCFNICLTQSKPFSSDSLSVTCISMQEILRQIRCLGAHHRMVVFFFATGSLLQKWDPCLKKTKALFCMEINKQSAGRAVAWIMASPLLSFPCEQLRVFN